MHLLLSLVDFVLHFDKHLADILQAYGTLTYLFLFLILFCETGLVVTPFLPGDSLLFAAGAFAAAGLMDIRALWGLLLLAAVLGDSTNYWIGRTLGPKVFHRTDSKLLNRKHLVRTQAFYDKHGGKTLILARFAPILRTFAPFVAGIGQMPYRRFLAFSVTGGVLWISLFALGGYFFGNLPTIKQNFKLVILGVIVVSLLPTVIELLRHWLSPAKASVAE
ncbi:MAG TPA: DedA family protein [Stenomitos sp.]